MRLPDRPVLNVVLGVVFALIVLGFLSWPGIVGSKQAPQYLVPAANVNSASSAQSLSSSSASSTSVLSSVQTAVSTSSSATVVAAASTSSVPAPTNSVGGNGSNASISSFRIYLRACTNFLELVSRQSLFRIRE